MSTADSIIAALPEPTEALRHPPRIDLPPLPPGSAPGSGNRSANTAAGSSAPAAAINNQKSSIKTQKLKTPFFARQMQKMEEAISRLSTRNNFWHRVCSWIWLPLAFRSGITFHKGSESTFSAVLPFRRFNRNWYNAMAGGALLGNAEVAGGMFVFEKCGGNYTVVCKQLGYKFLVPCHGPAVYRIEPREDLAALVKQGGEFNITVDMTVVQMVQAKGQRERRVGICTATFHVTPKQLVRQRARRRMARNLPR
ncbi:MAG: hypothetical protein IT445_13760 [Phycisphaeraceae bacterium]|nr:hypothetical protein [Phycisphaeraceae bacterium]